MERFAPGHQEMMRTMVTRLKRKMKMMTKTMRRKRKVNQKMSR